MTKLAPLLDKSKSLGHLYPELAKEFNAERNGLSAFEVKASEATGTRYWWFCDKGHEWDVTVRSRVSQNNTCPYCAGRLATPENNLQASHPEIAALFSEAKNKRTADSVIPNSNVKMYWTCPAGHEIHKMPKQMIRAKGACASCNKLSYRHPELRKYYHPDNEIPFDELAFRANKKVKWTCDNQHVYEQGVTQKTRQNLGCPFCSGRYATRENNLLKAYPEIAKEFDAVKNGVGPDQVTPKSNQKMWWACANGHSYDVEVSKKTREDLPYGCPYCSGYRIDDTNSFGVLFPELAAEFLTEENGVDPYKVPRGRTNVYKWKCTRAGHIFRTSISARTGSRKSGCPYCSGRYATPENNLAVLRPDDAKHFHPTKNHPLTPYTVSPFSNQKIYWICEVGHEWRTTPGSKMGCRQCSMSSSSKIEQYLKSAIVEAGVLEPDSIENHKLNIKWRRNSTMSVDIVGTAHQKNVVVEYDGYYYHSGIMSKDSAGDYRKDAQKTKALLDAGYYVVRIREINFNGTLPLLDLEHPHLLQIHYRYKNTDTAKDFQSVTEQIAGWLALGQNRLLPEKC